MSEFVDYGALWLADSGEGFSGKILGAKVLVQRNKRKEPGDNFPDWHIYLADADDKKSIGGLWAKHSDTKEVDWLSGSMTIGGEKQSVGLWPAKQTSDRSPAYRVMPPREKTPGSPPATAMPVATSRPVTATMPEGGEDFDDSEAPF